MASPIVMKGRAVVDNVLKSRGFEHGVAAGLYASYSANAERYRSTTGGGVVEEEGAVSSETSAKDDSAVQVPSHANAQFSVLPPSITNTSTLDISSSSAGTGTTVEGSLSDTVHTTKSDSTTSGTNESSGLSSVAPPAALPEPPPVLETPLKKEKGPFDLTSFASPLDFIRREKSNTKFGEGEELLDSTMSNNVTASSVSGKERVHTNGTSDQAAVEKQSTSPRDLRVPYGFCIISRVPTVNALRSPLALVSRNDEVMKLGVGSEDGQEAGEKDRGGRSESYQEYTHSQGVRSADVTGADPVDSPSRRGYGDGNGDRTTTWATKRAELLSQFIESRNLLRPLRQAVLNSARSTIPSFLRPGGAQDLDFEMVFRSLNPRNIVTVLIAFMLEFKIAVVSSKVSSLTVLGELLKTLISPLRWSHVYVPVLPKSMGGELLQCPTPFFVGLLRENFDASHVPADVCLLDLENDACRVPPTLGRALYAGRRLARNLDQLMRPSLFRCDDVDPVDYNVHKGTTDVSFSAGGFGMTHAIGASNGKHVDPVVPVSPNRPFAGSHLSKDIIRMCKVYVSDVLVGMDECSVHCVDHSELVVLFDEAMFLSFKQHRSKYSELPYDKAFMEQFMRTQCFSMCVATSILKRLNPESRPSSRPSSPFVSIANIHEMSQDGISTAQLASSV